MCIYICMFVIMDLSLSSSSMKIQTYWHPHAAVVTSTR